MSSKGKAFCRDYASHIDLFSNYFNLLEVKLYLGFAYALADESRQIGSVKRVTLCSGEEPAQASMAFMYESEKRN